MLERQEAPLTTAAALAVNEGALRVVSLPHRTLGLHRHMTRSGLQLACLAGLARPRGRAGPETLAGLLLDQRIDGALDQLAQIATPQRVAQELARFFELLIELGARRKLHSQARGRQRLEPRQASLACLGAGKRKCPHVRSWGGTQP